MRLAPTASERSEMERIYSDPRSASRAAVGAALYVGNDPVLTSTLRAYSDAEAPAVVLEATLPSPIPPTVVGLPARVVLRIAGTIRWVDYLGEVVAVGENPDGSGTLAAATAGYYQGGDTAIKFAGTSPTEYATTPDEALFDMLSRMPYNRIRVPQIKRPFFLRQGETAYPIVADVGSAIEELEGEARVKQKDTFLNEAIVKGRPTIGSVTAERSGTAWVVGREISEFSADPNGSSRFYSVAMVYQNPETGEYERLVREDARIRYEAPHMAPPRDVVYFEEMVPETNPVTGSSTGEFEENAANLQAQIAISLGLGGEHSISAVVPYIDPRIEDFDGRDIVKRDNETGIVTRWRATILAQERNYTQNTTTYTAVAVALFRRKPLDDPLPSFPDSGRPAPQDSEEPAGPLMASSTMKISEVGHMKISEAQA